MQVKALKTFQGRYGKIRAGETFNAEPGYVLALNKRKGFPMVEVLSKQDEPGPTKDRSKGEAPGRAGKEKPGDQGRPPVSDTAGQQGAGAALTSQSLPAVPASRARIAVPSPRGGRKGKPTPRKGNAKPATKTPSTPASAPPDA